MAENQRLQSALSIANWLKRRPEQLQVSERQLQQLRQVVAQLATRALAPSAKSRPRIIFLVTDVIVKPNALIAFPIFPPNSV